MEEKYYYISYLWTDLGNNFCCDVINIEPMDWLVRVNKGYYTYTDKKGKEKISGHSTKFILLNWKEITKDEYLKFPMNNMASYKARENFKLSYGENPY